MEEDDEDDESKLLSLLLCYGPLFPHYSIHLSDSRLAVSQDGLGLSFYQARAFYYSNVRVGCRRGAGIVWGAMKTGEKREERKKETLF